MPPAARRHYVLDLSVRLRVRAGGFIFRPASRRIHHERIIIGPAASSAPSAWVRPFRTHVASSVVCVSVCVGHTSDRAVQKRLNRSRCRLGETRVSPENLVPDGVVQIPAGIDNFMGFLLG